MLALNKPEAVEHFQYIIFKGVEHFQNFDFET